MKESTAKHTPFLSRELISGGVAGGLTKFTLAPLDIVKIRLQLQSHLTKKRSILSIARWIFKTEGVRGFWGGNVAGTLLWVIYGSLQFQLNALFKRHTQLPVFLYSGLSAVVGTMVTYPLDVARTQFAMQGLHKQFPSYASFLTHHLALGPASLFRGMGSGLLQVGGYMGLTFSFYEALNRISGSGISPSFLGASMSGFLSGGLGKLIVYPLDTVKRRMQCQSMGQESSVGKIVRYSSPVQCLTTMVRQEGPLSLFKGASPALLKASFSSSLLFAIYESTHKLLGPP